MKSSTRFTIGYVVGLFLIGLLSSFQQQGIQELLYGGKSDALVINVAGRQRALSQKITKTILAIRFLSTVLPSPARVAARADELRTALAQWQKADKGLSNGDLLLGLPGKPSNKIILLRQEIDPLFKLIHANGEIIAAGVNSDGMLTINVNLLNRIADEVLIAEVRYLAIQERIVDTYQTEADARSLEIARIEERYYSILLGILLLEAILIFIPIVQHIDRGERAQAESLRLQVEATQKEKDYGVHITQLKNELQSALDDYAKLASAQAENRAGSGGNDHG